MITYLGLRLPASQASDAFVAVDWAATTCGSPERWPCALKTATQLCLGARAPMALLWGDDDVAVYNDGLLQIFGRASIGAMGKPVRDAHPELFEVIGPLVDSVRKRRGSARADDRLILVDRDGRREEIYLELSCSPVIDERGQVGGVLCILGETTLERLQRRRALMLGSLGEVLSKLPLEERILPEICSVLQSNRMDFAHMALFAVQSDDSIATRWSEPADFAAEVVDSRDLRARVDRLPPEGRQSAVSMLAARRYALTAVDERLLEGRRFVMVVEPDPRVRIDANYEWLLRMTLDTILGAAYRILLERRTRAEMQIELSERDRLYRALFEYCHDCAFICSPGGRIIAANPAACNFLGYSEREIKALGRSGIAADEDGAVTRALAERSRDGRFVGELPFRRKDASVVVVDVSSTLFEDEVSGDGRAVVLFRDAAPRLAAQKRIAAAARLQAVGELTGGIAHDFNNLLNVIINGSELLVERLSDDAVARRDADLVLTASLRAADLTRELLACSRQQPMQGLVPPGNGHAVESVPVRGIERRAPAKCPDAIRRLLVVEDDDLFSSMLTSILEGAGYSVTVCSTGESALEVLRGADVFDLLITDIVLGPGADGWTVARQAHQRRPGMPVVTMSGFAPDLENSGAWSRVTLMKPFRPRELLEVLEMELEVV